MKTAKEDFLATMEQMGEIKCADLTLYNKRDKRLVYLPVNYSKQEFDLFLNKMDVFVDNKLPFQGAMGTVWFKDGNWAARNTYGNSPWWVHYVIPVIPDKLIKAESTEMSFETF
jgi:hypothetical protein